MNIATMRRLDAWLGIPLCVAATALEKVRVLFTGGATVPGKRLLVLKLSEQGAIVILGDSLRRLHQTYAFENTWFMAFDASHDILEVMDLVPRENLITISTKSLPAFMTSMIGALFRIWTLRIDVVLDLEFFSRTSAIIAWLTGARRRVGVHNYFGEGPYRGELMTHGVKFNPHLHISQMIRVMAEAVTLPDGELQRMEFSPPPVSRIEDRFSPSPAEMSAVDALLRECGWHEGERIVLLNSNVSDRELIPLRKWDESKYAEVGRRILADFPDVRVLLTGSPREAAGVEALKHAIGSPRCVSVAGRTGLRELLTLYTRATLMVTNDSGPAHFAALANMAVVVLFGPETPQLWAPLGKEVHVVYRRLACSPCFTITNGRQSGCRRNACMDMTPEEVFSVAAKLLGNKAQRADSYSASSLGIQTA